MLGFTIIFLLTGEACLGFSINPQNSTIASRINLEDGEMTTMTSELIEKRRNEKLDLLGHEIDLPQWVSDVKEKSQEMMNSAFGKSTKSRLELVSQLKNDESTRILLAVYANIFVIFLVYFFIAVKLMCLSMDEKQEKRRKRKTNHLELDAAYNLPSIATRPLGKRPSAPPLKEGIENPVSDFVEIAREDVEQDDEMVPPRTEPYESAGELNSIYDEVPETNEIE